MIIKFEQYNESIKDLMVGPTKEEVWSDLMNGKLKGLIKSIPDSPEDFFNEMKEGCIKIYKDKYGIYYGKNDKILFQEDSRYVVNTLYINNKYIWSIFRKIYGYNDNKIKLFIEDLLVDDIKWNNLNIEKSIIE